jgi:hypothetical protein
MRIPLIIIGLVVLCTTNFAKSPTPLSVIDEPETFKEDPEVEHADLAYRVCIRPMFSSPIAMKVYITFKANKDGVGFIATGRFVLKGIEDGTIDKPLRRETSLSDDQVMALLFVIREQEIFNLRDEPSYTPEDIANRTARLDPSIWSFERIQMKPDTRYPDYPPFASVRRTQSDHGPAREVFVAFSAHAQKLLPKGNQLRVSRPSKSK